MEMTKRGKRCGCNEYEVRDRNDVYFGWLYKKYNPWITPTGKRPGWEWVLEIDIDYPVRLDDEYFLSFVQAKEWLLGHVS